MTLHCCKQFNIQVALTLLYASLRIFKPPRALPPSVRGRWDGESWKDQEWEQAIHRGVLFTRYVLAGIGLEVEVSLALGWRVNSTVHLGHNSYSRQSKPSVIPVKVLKILMHQILHGGPVQGTFHSAESGRRSGGRAQRFLLVQQEGSAYRGCKF